MDKRVLEKIKKRQLDLDKLQKDYNIDANYIAYGVLVMLFLRIATDKEWKDTLEIIRLQRAQ